MPGRTWQTTQVTSQCEDFIQLSYEGAMVWQPAQNAGCLVYRDGTSNES